MTAQKDFSLVFREIVGRDPERRVGLAGYSSFRIGGPADYFFEARSSDDLKSSVQAARSCGVPFYIIGGGYNLLFDDAGYRGLIIKNGARGLHRPGKTVLEVQSGTPLRDVVDFCMTQGLGGLEFLAGIPGTVGGAVYGNAGAFGRDIGGRVIRGVLLGGTGERVSTGRKEFDFGYRHSTLKKHPSPLLEVALRVREVDRGPIREQVESYLKKRETRHPPCGVPCAGSFFKNPVQNDGSRVAAALLLDRVGAKALRVGDASVYEGHANFIINSGEATAAQIRSLAATLKKKVWESFGIALEEEVIFLPEDPSRS